ncbi:protein of unknown function [Burkholderia multivorans]
MSFGVEVLPAFSMESISTQQNVQARRTKPGLLLRQFAQTLPIGTVDICRRRPPKRPSIQANERARPALLVIVLLHCPPQDLPAPHGRTHFFRGKCNLG